MGATKVGIVNPMLPDLKDICATAFPNNHTNILPIHVFQKKWQFDTYAYRPKLILES